MKILAFAGSSSSQSINKALVKQVLKSFPEAEINLLDLNDFEMPIFSVDREKQGFPPQAQQFLDAIAEADAIICSMAEHNRNLTAAFKNIFDWCSRINVKVFQDKKMLLMSTSPGGFGGGNSMNIAKNMFPAFGAEIIETFSLPKFYENFDMENGIIQQDLATELQEKIKKFKLEITL
ncbi:NADPH-dependent oxidoreductase [Ornithobacterium rhinotracheale]|uniref:NADPH-dependent oxidoreductase n=1 Tax=Ornithobacterium rhinotracheale TaxID=28251 RepID=A0A3R5UV58_ORNRH|nr:MULTISPECIES: NAD(P)H-dependent oxidoreductase [Weeksellaceae]QAR31254.1 NADPH-dependent oxidoreductase [Ornithobacterium rhinotracheale]WKS94591.1 NAD(P)H-dependent oxidoreductase [Riemerella columbina]